MQQKKPFLFTKPALIITCPNDVRNNPLSANGQGVNLNGNGMRNF
jgi:hypothetical protein